MFTISGYELRFNGELVALLSHCKSSSELVFEDMNIMIIFRNDGSYIKNTISYSQRQYYDSYILDKRKFGSMYELSSIRDTTYIDSDNELYDLCCKAMQYKNQITELYNNAIKMCYPYDEDHANNIVIAYDRGMTATIHSDTITITNDYGHTITLNMGESYDKNSDSHDLRRYAISIMERFTLNFIQQIK